jgi:hypothetical protein
MGPTGRQRLVAETVGQKSLQALHSVAPEVVGNVRRTSGRDCRQGRLDRLSPTVQLRAAVVPGTHQFLDFVLVLLDQ